MPSYRLLPAAEASLVEIFSDSITHWGLTQADKYKAGLLALFQRIAQQPEMGRLRPELAPALRSFPYESHVIFYREGDDAVIQIIDVLHGSRDAVLYTSWDIGQPQS